MQSGELLRDLAIVSRSSGSGSWASECSSSSASVARTSVLDTALELGADAVYTPSSVPPALRSTDVSRWAVDRGFDVVVEASGTQAGLSLAGELVRTNGVLSILGFHQNGARSIDMEMWNWKAIDVVNAHVRRPAVLVDATQVGLALMSAGRLTFAPLVTHRFDLVELDDAFRMLRDKPPGFIKAVISIG